MKETTTLFQHGTLALLIPGLFAGTLSAGDLVKHGDTGIGTLDALNGEVIVIDGQVYQAAEDGHVYSVPDTAMMPFASVHFSDINQPKISLEGLNQDQFSNWLIEDRHLKNAFAAITLHGQFSMVHVRVAPKQTVPFPPLTAATAHQPEFTREQVSGTVVGYFAPDLYAGATVAGCHLHFISDDRQFAGHLLDFQLIGGEGGVQLLPNLLLHLPTDNATFMNADIELNGLNDAINQAEH
ncbi:acetolactate decarboxylase [Furfurilactobacillus curtus]|uniref:Alpha-acetolactate decarboxylase n=1 Tax=Furfurilactobacillus curtus TaxID=1746200 RepID=A0ABQ5JLD2_9LACO